jgi:hypothetical protein
MGIDDSPTSVEWPIVAEPSRMRSGYGNDPRNPRSAQTHYGCRGLWAELNKTAAGIRQRPGVDIAKPLIGFFVQQHSG